MINITDLTIANLVIDKCRIENNVLNIHYRIFWANGMILSHCYNVQLQNITVYRTDQHRSALLVINILGISSFINITSNGLKIEYNEVNVDDKHNKLLLRNHQFPSYAKYSGAVVVIYLLQKSYKVELKVYNATIAGLNTSSKLFKVIQTANTYGNFIHFNQCFVEKFISDITNDMFYFESSGYSYLQVIFTNCIFIYNKKHRVFTVYGYLKLKLENSIFKYNQFQVIRMIDSSYQSSLIITNTSFYSITSSLSLIYLSNVLLHLDGPVIFHKVKADKILYSKYGIISCHGYIEFSENSVSYTDHARYISVQVNALINMTNNEYSTIKNIISYHYETFVLSKYTTPCYYQYTAKEQKFDKLTEKLKFSIVYHNDTSIHTLMLAHCIWLPGSAFNLTKPADINNRLIKRDFPLRYGEEPKLLCHCNYDAHLMQDCYTDTLAKAYPGQTISLSLVLDDLSKDFIVPYADEDIQFREHFFTIEINDHILPSTACKVAQVNELIHKIYYTSCTVANFTIVHNGLSYLHWCELFINIISTNITDAYYIDILPCPTGFVQQNGICICDPILNSQVLSITTCDINYQTILRPAGSWLTAVTINDSHQYHISPHCPLHYCLSQSSQLNFSTPNSQCQFNRTGLLCGHCQQGLSTILGYSHCQHCSNVYLLLIIPIAVAGLVLVFLLFILNLTVTDGDINGFIFYANIININIHVFFPHYGNSLNIIYAFISLVNLDLGIPTCFYNGMDDYAKMWLQLAFPAYLILIATLLIIASRHSTTVQKITARRALPVLATLFLLSYTKVLRTISNVLFYYSTITQLPSGHTTLVWTVDANVPLFGLKYTALFIVYLILFIILLPFNAILCFTKTAMRLKLVNHFKPLIDAYQGPYKYKYYYWAGLQLVLRAVFFGLSALDRNINLTVGNILLAVTIIIQSRLIPYKDNYKNLHETVFIFNLLVMYALSHDHYDTAVSVMIGMAALQFLLIIIHHIISNVCGGVIIHKLKIVTSLSVKWTINKPQHIQLSNIPPERSYNYQELREPLVGQD